MKTMKQLMGRWVLPMAFATSMAVIPALGVTHVAKAQSDPVSVLVAWEKVALGDGQDIDAALGLMTDDAVLKVIPPPAGTSGVWTGKAEIRQALIFNKAQNVKRENVGVVKVEGNNISTVSMVSNNAFMMWGVAPVEHLTEAVVVSGKITSYTSTMAQSERARVGAATAAYQAAHPAQAVQATDPASVLVAWEKVALGDGQDIDAALALMTDDAVLKVIPEPAGTSGVWVGKEQIRQALLFNKAQNVRRENVGTPAVDGKNVSTVSMVSNNAFVIWGVVPVQHLTEAVVVNGKIASYTSTMAPSERGRVGAAATAYQAAQTQQPLGMPSTGEGQGPVALLLLALAGMVAFIVGLGMRQRAGQKVR